MIPQILKDNEAKWREMCERSGISYYLIGNSFMYKLLMYANTKNLIRIVHRLDFNDTFSCRVALNRYVASGSSAKKWALQDVTEEHEEAKRKLFDFLDGVQDPYFFISHPFLKYGKGGAYQPKDYVQDPMSGSRNIDIACDYAKYIINKPAKMA